MKNKHICKIVISVFLVTLMTTTAIASAASCNNKKDNNYLKKTNEDVHQYNIGYLKLDGTQWEENGKICTAVIHSEYNDFTINNYNEGDTIILSVDWTIIKDKIGPWKEPPYGQSPEWHPTCEEKWEFKIVAHDELSSLGDNLSYDIYEEEIVTIEDTLLSESGKTGTVDLEFSIPREEFYGDYFFELQIKIQANYYRWCWKPFDHWGDLSDLDNLEYAHTDVFFDGALNSPEITYTNDIPSKISFDKKVEFNAKATDTDGDKIRFYFDWDGDGWDDFHQDDTVTKWQVGPDAEVTLSHTWKKEDYPDEKEHIANPRVIVEDGFGMTSSWSSFGEITVPKTKETSVFSLSILSQFLEKIQLFEFIREQGPRIMKMILI